MAKTSSILWANGTLNFFFGCRKVDLACRGCYMFRIVLKPRSFYEKGPRKNPYTETFIQLREVLNTLAAHVKLSDWPISKKPIFVNSMTDTFGEFFSDERLIEWHRLFSDFPQHNFALLTKRIGRANLFYRKNPQLLKPNIWVGCSIGERSRLFRLTQLKQIPAKVRFISFEPLIEDLGEINLEGIHWALVGGESGYKENELRKMDAQWALKLKELSRKYGVAFFFKQIGGLGGDGAGGDKLFGDQYHELPDLEEKKTELGKKLVTLEMFQK